jgi:hypothetical protein
VEAALPGHFVASMTERTRAYLTRAYAPDLVEAGAEVLQPYCSVSRGAVEVRVRQWADLWRVLCAVASLLGVTAWRGRAT